MSNFNEFKDKKLETPLIVRADGLMWNCEPADGKRFTLEELQKICGGHVQLITFPNGLQMWMNEEGKLDGLELNRTATLLWKVIYFRYAIGSDDFVCGNVLITPPKFTE
jgi:hypothetical protein